MPTLPPHQCGVDCRICDDYRERYVDWLYSTGDRDQEEMTNE